MDVCRNLGRVFSSLGLWTSFFVQVMSQNVRPSPSWKMLKTRCRWGRWYTFEHPHCLNCLREGSCAWRLAQSGYILLPDLTQMTKTPQLASFFRYVLVNEEQDSLSASNFLQTILYCSLSFCYRFCSCTDENISCRLKETAQGQMCCLSFSLWRPKSSILTNFERWSNLAISSTFMRSKIFIAFKSEF